MKEFSIDRGSFDPGGGQSTAERRNELHKGRGVKMSAGNLIFLLVIAGGAFAMFSMHRGGGHSHGAGGGGCGGGGHGNGHDHGQGPTDTEASSSAPSDGEKKPLLGKPGTQTHEHQHGAEPVGDGKQHRGC